MLELASSNFSVLWFEAMGYLKLNAMKTTISALAILVVTRIYQSHQRPKTPRLQGPRSQNHLFEFAKKPPPPSDPGLIYQDWERKYGLVYETPGSMGSRHIILGDPKAIAHFLSKDTTTYRMPTLQRTVSRRLFGDNLAAVEGQDHKRQRKALSPAFSISAIRSLTPVFIDTAYKLKAAWDSSFQLSNNLTDTAVIDVQQWMNYVSLDSLGTAGFSHDFGALRGQAPVAMAALDFFSTVKPSLALILSLLVRLFVPGLFTRLLGKGQEMWMEVATSLKVIATGLLNEGRRGAEYHNADRSILGVMIRSESASSRVHMSTNEIIAQNMFLSAGYETTSTTLTWALIELARHPKVQETLRAELQATIAAGEDPTYDQLLNDLPYLDAFTCELLRVHPAAHQILRVANEDDTIPLTSPVRTASGAMIDDLFVKKGTIIRISFAGVNASEVLWGPDAGAFNPGRWLVRTDTEKGRKEEVKGYRHLLTFAYGPRMCPGREFAITEIKAVLSVLVRNFVLEFPNGPSTKLGNYFLRPKVADEEGARVPVLVRRAM